MSEKIRVLHFPVKKPSVVAEISKSGLEDRKALVGGPIEAVALEPDNLYLICNEEGKLKRLRPNLQFFEIGDCICGDFYISRVDPDTGEDVSLTQDDIDWARLLYDHPGARL